MVNDRFYAIRRRMVAEQIRSRGIHDERLLDALMEIPRHFFVPPHLSERAYDDGPLPIGEGQTISQPYIVAEMTRALSLSGEEKVLEIGTGSGYQTAVLCRLAKEVVTMERIGSLQETAEKVLKELGIGNIRFLAGDGTMGCPGEAPFDRILVTAAAPRVPEPLFEQLADGGIAVIPIGGRWEQDLIRVTKDSGKARKEFLGGCRFVPLIGRFGFPE
ncbi:MAG: protein-L-isoaspartate(D-aspartate) O-methyltransferase [Deltaproteobacteria bacterium]|nr:protein-L-isoaspartate(D-aspartate) O-methyltransferase [Deltaproteobacteria bacterium]